MDRTATQVQHGRDSRLSRCEAPITKSPASPNSVQHRLLLNGQNRSLVRAAFTQSTELNDEIRRKHDDLAAELAREANELRHDKTDRAALADLLTEMALRLNNQFRLPGE